MKEREKSGSNRQHNEGLRVWEKPVVLHLFEWNIIRRIAEASLADFSDCTCSTPLAVSWLRASLVQQPAARIFYARWCALPIVSANARRIDRANGISDLTFHLCGRRPVALLALRRWRT